MGCSTLYHLAKYGVSDAILLERNKLTSGTTWHSAAQVRALRSTSNLTDLIKYSISLYSTLEQETGQQTGWINKGSLSIATNQDRMIHVRRQEALAHSFGVRASSITAGEAKERWPLMNADDVLGAVWSPDDGRVSPSDLCAALVKGAKVCGAKVFEDTGVKGIVTEGDRIIAVETEGGQIRCDAIALCSGLWSRENASMAGVDVPVWPCEHFYLLTKPVPGIVGNMPTLSDHDAHLYIRDDSGGLLVGCFEPEGKSISPQALGHDFAFQLLDEDWSHFEPMMLNAMHRLPVLEHAEVKMLLNGPESFTPDGSFLLGESAETRGLFLGCGMNSVGVATGGGGGMALAKCIVEGHMPMDLHEADPKRFATCFNSVKVLSERAPEVLGKHYEISYPGRQMATARNLRKLPLADKWVSEKASFGQVYGWERPMYFNCQSEPELTFGKPGWFDQVGQEVQQAHTGAAVFDQSSFGKIRVVGPDAERVLNRICANNMARSVGSVIYTAMLNEKGGFESNLTAFRLSEEKYMLFVGTASVKRDLAWLKRHIETGDRVALEDVTEHWAVLGLMGPDTEEIAQSVGAGSMNQLGYFRHDVFEVQGVRIRAARMSYVGERGWEITCPVAESGKLYDILYAQGARPAGMYAQSSMRIEKRFLSYGHDLDSDISPFQAGLDFAMDMDTEFVGKQALLQIRAALNSDNVTSIPDRVMVSILLEDVNAPALGNEPVYFNGKVVGRTTSAAFGYRVKRPVALAYLDNNIASDLQGLKVEVDIARSMFRGMIVTNAVFDPEGRRVR